MMICYLLVRDGTDSPVYTLFVSLVSAAVATVFGKHLDGKSN